MCPVHAPDQTALTSEYELKADALTCERGQRVLFQDLTLTIEPGQVWLIEGANGSGKTTLLRVLCGLRRPDEGDVLWNGARIESVRPEFNAAIAYLGHYSGLKEDLTAAENLRFSCALQGSDGDAAAALARTGLDIENDLPVSSFSAGQRRRLAMARLLLSPARVWLLDEPFTALDPAGRTLVRDLLGEFAARGGAAALATHHEIAVDGADIHRLEMDAPAP
ncbi:cytochrome c biogenesis heme-transporting ATPase CcmA [Ectothiorhodospiraceae bacterium WFHF3C12]|nr:cytochrome c biogenesis heme-transporting ATPase CcmA [Ectothiorhodospiraceae bacterium WFHF3C12]